MSDQPAHLTPYGKPPVARRHGAFYVYDDPDTATRRAEAKLRTYLDGSREDLLAGRNFKWLIIYTVLALVILSIAVLPFLIHQSTCAPMIGAPLSLILLMAGYRTYRDSGVGTPRNCVREFCQSINRADTERAYALIAPVDKDSYMRGLATVTEQDPFDIKKFSFESRGEFTAYWSKMRAVDSSARLALKPGQGNMQLTPDIAVVDLLLEIQRTLRPESASNATPLRRILLRYGDEWRLFNGDALPWDEVDKKWFDRLIQQARKDRPE